MMKTKNFKLTISKKDLLYANFTNPCDCPIARALKRQGVEDPFICSYDADFDYKGKSMVIEGEKFRNLSQKVLFMTKRRKAAQTFSIKLTAHAI